jgi:hypothetical protein
MRKDFEGWDDRIIESLLTVGETRKIRERGVLGNKVNRKLVINGSLQEAETGYDAYLIPPWDWNWNWRRRIMDTAVGLDWRRRVKDFEGWDDRIIESILTVEGTRKIWERGVPGTRY